MKRLWLLLLLSATLLHSRPIDSQDRAPELILRQVLDNGVTVLFYPVQGAEWVGVETIYRAGFFDEGAGQTQLSHLAEHMMCQSATAKRPARKAMVELNRLGMANAETLATWTHYDYLVPRGQLETALTTEFQRLDSLKLEVSVLREEIPRCYAEVDAVERSPRAGVFKFALMALNQTWRHGATRVRVRGGLEDSSTEDVRGFLDDRYRPDRLIVAIAGGDEPAEVFKLVREHLGAARIEKPQTSATRAAISWEKLPRRQEVTWDVKVTAVCVTYAPPADRAESLALSFWGVSLLQRLSADPRLRSRAAAIFCSTPRLIAGGLPFLVYATAKGGASAAELETEIDRILGEVRSANTNFFQLLRMKSAAANLVSPRPMSWTDVALQGKQISSRLGVDEKKGAGMALINLALQQAGFRELIFGAEIDALAKRLKAIDADGLKKIIDDTLNPDAKRVTVLVPEKEPRTKE